MGIEAEQTKSYYDLLSDVARSDDYSGILEYLPKFYTLLCNIISDDTTSWYARTLANTALGHLVLEDDIIPDSLGAEGYLDDLFLMAYVLKEIRDNVSGVIISKNVEGSGIEKDDIFDVIYKIQKESKEFLGEKAADVLKLVGIEDFTSLDLLCKCDASSFTENAKEKLRLLYAMAAVSLFDGSFLDLRALQEDAYMWEDIIQHPDFVEVKRYGGLLK